MITKDNLKELLFSLKFEEQTNVFSKHFAQGDFYLKVNFNTSKIIYPEALKVGGEFTTNFTSPENFVVLECVHNLLMKGYKPEHIELEPKWKVGHGASGGRADIFIKNQAEKPLLIIECKTFGKEFTKEWKEMQLDGGQLFTYIEQEKDIEFVCLYASDFDEKTKERNIEQRIISHKDNIKILADDPKLKSFRDAKNVKERFKVWKDTYLLEFTEKGIFEENIQPYQIGKDKYTLDIDTKIIDSTDKKGKYHQFRTILRKHNVSRRENAFEVLVNLFLCKIVDEKENKDNLNFYWKGIAYDNYFDLVDRLQALYKIGMEQFLEQEITYISDKQIDEIFWSFKQKRSAVKQEIKSVFKQLKFYKGLDFEFIKVHNKEKFDKNAKILLEIIQMWQGLRLKTKEQNQFLGDMFEFFLDNGIKQSEGQFFTPVPICKFIVMSLPLESLIQEKNEALKAIDYACGSGHFLTEYALQIKPLVTKHKQVEPAEYYRNIYGIEKEDRLAKVAKVSAFMYGLDEIQIIDADALVPNEKIKEGKFDVLVANPPFAVEDFLMTLEEEDREKYELLNSVSDLGNKNIQCFFLERTKQLLAGNGVAGIVVPSSILSNSDAMHVQTREILLKFFDFISIVELGSGTFGKTGTNTVVLFLRRKAQRPEPAEHYWNRTLDFFDNWNEELKTGGGAYADIDVVRNYCQHIEIPFEEYQQLLDPKIEVGKEFPHRGLGGFEIFKDYKTDFDALNEIKKLKETKQYKDKTTNEKQAELDKRFIGYLQEIEKQKLYYFMLADSQSNKILLVKSPSDNTQQRQFLGYEWSGAKGSEGIIYKGGETVYDIITPMFDPRNPQNVDKINYLIQQNFSPLTPDGGISIIPDHLKPFVSYANLTDLLDFSRKDFNKAFSLTPKKNVGIESKWEVVKLGEIKGIKWTNGYAFKSDDMSEKLETDYLPVLKIGNIDSSNFSIKTDNIQYHKKISNDHIVNSGDLVIALTGATVGKSGYVNENFLLNQRVLALKAEKYILKYCSLFLFSEIFYEYAQSFSHGSAQGNLSPTQVQDFKIPLPPLEIQQQIVAECEAVDKAVDEAREDIKQKKESKENLISDIFGKYSEQKISEISHINPSKTEIRNVDENTLVSFIEMSSVSNNGFIVEKVDRPLKDLKKGSFTYFAENDIIIAKITPCMENGKCALTTNLTNGLAMGSSEFHVIRVKENISNEFVFAFLNREIVRKEAEQNFTGSSGHRRVPASFYADYKIPVPPLAEQQKLVAEIEAIEAQIASNQQIINEAAAQKQAIMKKYL